MMTKQISRAYPRKSDVTRAVQAARDNGLVIRTIVVSVDGSIKVSSTGDQVSGREAVRDEFDLWNEEGRL